MDNPQVEPVGNGSFGVIAGIRITSMASDLPISLWDTSAEEPAYEETFRSG